MSVVCCIYYVVIILRMEAPWVGSHNWYILTKPRSETDLEKCPTDNVQSFILSTKKNKNNKRQLNKTQILVSRLDICDT